MIKKTFLSLLIICTMFNLAACSNKEDVASLIPNTSVIGAFSNQTEENPLSLQSSEAVESNEASATQSTASSKAVTITGTSSAATKPKITADAVNGEEVTLRGKLCYDGACYLQLDKPFRFQDDGEDDVVSDSTIGFDGKESLQFEPYVGMIVTLQGYLYNYRDGGDLRFNSVVPTKLLSTSGTATGIPRSSTYKNWNTTDNKTKYWDAVSIVEKIPYKCKKVNNVRCNASGDELEFVNENGFGDIGVPVYISINDQWIGDDISSGFYILPKETHFELTFVKNYEDCAYWSYDWAGKCLKAANGYEFDEYLSHYNMIP